MSGILLVSVGNSYGPSGLQIGDPYEGGFYAGQISTAANGIADYNLVIAPKSSGESSDNKAWKTSNTATSGTTSGIDGPGNTAAMIAAGAAAHPAADFCNGLSIGGFSDWYLPARYELEICYYNLKPTTNANRTDVGTNIYAVPSRGSNYTSGNPAQTTATDFKTGNTEAFASDYYWSSTEISAIYASLFRFVTGQQENEALKDQARFYARGVRRVAV